MYAVRKYKIFVYRYSRIVRIRKMYITFIINAFELSQKSFRTLPLQMLVYIIIMIYRIILYGLIRDTVWTNTCLHTVDARNPSILAWIIVSAWKKTTIILYFYKKHNILVRKMSTWEDVGKMWISSICLTHNIETIWVPSTADRPISHFWF